MHLTNVVLTCQILGCKPTREQFVHLAQTCSFVEYKPNSSFKSMIRIQVPAADTNTGVRDRLVTGLLFSNGKMIVNGATSVAMAKQGGRKIARLVQRKLKQTHTRWFLSKWCVRNVVLSGYFDNHGRRQLDLTDL